MSAGGVIGPTLGGFLMERLLHLAFVVAAGIVLAAAGIVLVFVRESLGKPRTKGPEKRLQSLDSTRAAGQTVP